MIQFTGRELRVVLVASVVALAAIGAVPAMVTGQEQRGLPTSYYGDITVGNEAAPAGTEVIAEVDQTGERYTIAVGPEGQYGDEPDSTGIGAKLDVDEPGINDDDLDGNDTTITFFVNGDGYDEVEAETDPSGPHEWMSDPEDKLQEVDLSVPDVNPILRIEASISNSQLQVDETAQLTVDGIRQEGDPVDRTDEAEFSGFDDSVVEVSDDGTVEAVGTGTTIITANLPSIDGDDGEADIAVSVGTGGDDDGGDDDDDGGGGGGGGSAPAPAPDEGDDEPPSVQDVRDRLTLVDSTQTTAEITDADPDTSGVTVQPEETQSVREITFNNEELTGSVDVTEYNSEQIQDISEQVAESVTNQVENVRLHTDGSLDDDRTVQPEPSEVDIVSVTDITVTSDSDDPNEDQSATVRLSVDRDQVDNPQNLVVVKETFNQEQQTNRWNQLETTVQETGDEEITVEAQVPDFSLFAVAEIEPADEQPPAQVEDDGEETPDPEGENETVGIIIAILVIVGAAGAAVYFFGQEPNGNE